ncbi:tyrosine-type recombinase/integrase [Enterocloster lavalensis]|uniref:tyrosine-type recombinase/integrase n=2 Tax=Enterocloster lavalensis TaxID=460384 RepID=UPI0023F33FCF|nr:tyrosine-type recombinase/integrase [Enterocloster lavalensis]
MKDNQKRIITTQKIDDYCLWLDRCERSRETIQKYEYYLTRFKEFMDCRPVDKEMVILWKSVLRENLAPVTVNGALAALNGFFKYCDWQDCRARFLKISKNTFYPESRELTKKEYLRLVRTAADQGNERLSLLLETICSSGIRVSELPFITVAALCKGQAEVECKGRIRTVLLTKRLCKILLDYAARKGIESGMIFVTRSGKALDRSNIWREMKALGLKANVDREKIFPHNLRHLFARTYYAMTKDLSKLADILGHKDINTTRIYTIESGSRHRKQLESMRLIVTPYNAISILLYSETWTR